jgi:MOSC domain-containing protein YiiM
MTIDQRESTPIGSVVSVNVGRPRDVEWAGRRVRTAIWKEPTSERVSIALDNLAGDEQADLRVHGGPDKAVYSYASEDYRWWEERLGVHLDPGTFWAVGSAILQVAQTRQPCFKLGIRMGDAGFVQEFDRARRFGVYLRVSEAGQVGVGDEIFLLWRPTHGMTAAIFADILDSHDPLVIRRFLETDGVPEGIKLWARRQIERAGRAGS